MMSDRLPDGRLIHARAERATFDDIAEELGKCGPAATNRLRWLSAESEDWFRALDEFPEAAFFIAQVKLLPEAVADHLARHPDEDVRMGLAMLGRLPDFPNAHQILLQDPVSRIRVTADKTTRATDP